MEDFCKITQRPAMVSQSAVKGSINQLKYNKI